MEQDYELTKLEGEIDDDAFEWCLEGAQPAKARI
jgi:hypothetical protein